MGGAWGYWSMMHVIFPLNHRNPRYNDRPSFDEIFELLNRTDSDILSWSEEDKSHCSQMAAQIGAPVNEGASLYQDLQKTYQITLV